MSWPQKRRATQRCTSGLMSAPEQSARTKGNASTRSSSAGSRCKTSPSAHIAAQRTAFSSSSASSRISGSTTAAVGSQPSVRASAGSCLHMHCRTSLSVSCIVHAMDT